MADSKVFCMDCLEAMQEMSDDSFDLAVVDPPYGVGIDKHKTEDGCYVVANRRTGWRAKIGSTLYHSFDDSEPPGAEYFRELMRVSKNQIIWGGNYFLDHLGPTSCMIVWDKGKRGLSQADCEIAWTSFRKPSRIFEFRWNGMLQGNMKEKEIRIHPTQKPVELYRWIFERYAKPGDRILDTHMGSQSSRIAAYDAGLDFVGCEIDPIFFKEGNARFDEYVAQVSLFH